MKKIIFMVFMCLSLVASGQTTAISLQEYNDRCSRNEETIIDVSTIEELFDYFNYGQKKEKVSVVTDEVNNIITYLTIPAPNKVRLYGFVFEYGKGSVIHRTKDPIGDMKWFMVRLRNKTCPNDTIIYDNTDLCVGYAIKGYKVVYWGGSSRQHFVLYQR